MVFFLSMAIVFSCSSSTKSQTFVTFCTGDATLQRGSAAQTPLQIKDQLQDGDTLKTGAKSYVVVQNTDGLVLRIEQNTELAMSSFNSAAKREISLSKGKVLSSVGKLKKGSEYTVKTPTAIAAVRGTEFLTEFNGKNSIVAVGKGKVSVERTSGNPDGKIVETGNTAVVAEKKDTVALRTINTVETLELSKLEKTPVIENVEKKSSEEIKDLFRDTEAADKKINFEIREETGLTFPEMKDAFSRIDVITLFNGRVIQGIIVSRGETYKILTTTGPVTVSAKEVQRTEVK
jgi:uncharacterized pyridoxamine 5'-phosphate oxidase family protein